MSDWKHIEIHNHGTIVVLRPISDESRQWFEDNVDLSRFRSGQVLMLSDLSFEGHGTFPAQG